MAVPPDNAAPPEPPATPSAPTGAAPVSKKPRTKAKAARKEKPKPQPPAKTPPSDETDAEETPTVKRGFLTESPSWLASLVVHLLVLMLLAVSQLPKLPELAQNLLLVEPGDNELADLDDLPEMILDAVELETEPVEFELQPETDVIAEQVSFSTFNEATSAPTYNELSDLALTSAQPSNPTDMQGFDGTGTTGRGRMARTALVRKNGGSKASEKAVADALNWLAEHQNPDGTWSLVHDRGRCRGRCGNAGEVPGQGDDFPKCLVSGTGLALLPFLGAGQTHEQGRHRKTVERGLMALVRLGKETKNGVSWMDSGRLYAHAIAAIALTEAYGMTKDKRLREPAQAAVNFIVYAQDRELGGWRYQPRVDSDTSVTGWQIMALKSGYLAGLSVNPDTVRRAGGFLDKIQQRDGARYPYLAVAEGGGAPRASVTLSAVGLLCRMYMGWEQDNPALKVGAASIARPGPSESNYYHNYYVSQVLFQYTGGEGKTWRDWNRALREQLIEQQEKTGHAKGSWFVDGNLNRHGGRLYMTSMATMCLEIYYRYMPIYQADAVEREFGEK